MLINAWGVYQPGDEVIRSFTVYSSEVSLITLAPQIRFWFLALNKFIY